MNFLNFQGDSNRATILSVSDISNVNEYTMTSDVTESQPISMDHNRRLVTEMVNNIFDERRGTCEISSSSCSSLKLQSSDYSYDKRLKYWKDVLKERENLTSKILQQTNKRPADILYNRLATVDNRNKQTVKRLMDYAERVSPSKLSTKQCSILPEKFNMDRCFTIQELQETLPKAERKKGVMVEISGLPKVTKTDLLGKPKHQGSEKSNSWLKSKYLEKRIEEIRHDMERVIEYYPDVENLQIIGESMTKTKLQQHNSEIQIMPSEEIYKISSDDDNNCVCPVDVDVTIEPEPIEYGIKINDQIFIMSEKRNYKNVDILQNFYCFPFETEVKKIMTIQNMGRKVLNFEWSQHSYYDKNSSTLLKSLDNEFIFDKHSFRLYGGESLDIMVRYQPRRVEIVKSKWILKVQPSFFCRKLEGVVMRLCGICAAPPDYEHKLNEIQMEVIEKSNKKMMRKLTTGLSAIIPDLGSCAQICPFQRTLNELELFEQLNSGYKCERYHDLELLKDLYKRVKKPRDKLWNLNINNLKCAILRVNEPQTRALYFNELSGILETMKGKCMELEKRILENPERDRSCLLYVRGIICASIDEWEDLTITLEETLKSALRAVDEKYQTPEDENEVGDDTIFVMLHDVRRLKSFRDSLYMQTYTLLCNFVENFVNVIEGIEVV